MLVTKLRCISATIISETLTVILVSASPRTLTPSRPRVPDTATLSPTRHRPARRSRRGRSRRSGRRRRTAAAAVTRVSALKREQARPVGQTVVFATAGR